MANKDNPLGVYKLQCNNKTYYKAGFGPYDAQLRLARELKIIVDKVRILDNGKKQ